MFSVSMRVTPLTEALPYFKDYITKILLLPSTADGELVVSPEPLANVAPAKMPAG